MTPDEDPIVAEVHATRARIMAEFNYDLAAYMDYIRQREEQARREGRVFLDPPPPAKSVADRDAA